MAASTMTAGLRSAVLVPAKLEAKSLKAAPASQSFAVKKVSAKVSCSAEKSIVEKVTDAGKAALVALASTALVASSAHAAAPRLTFDELQSKTYLEIKGTGIANQCPDIPDAAAGLTIKSGKYQATKFCLEPTSIQVKTEKTNRKGETSSDFSDTKLLTRLTYTLDEIEGPFTVDGEKVTFQEVDGIDYAALTVQLPGGTRVPLLFTVKELVASGPASGFSGEFTVPSYRGASFLDPKGRGGTTGYEASQALPAGDAASSEELEKENDKSYKALKGTVEFKITQSNAETGEIGGTFVSFQPSDTDMGAKVPKDVKIEGLWYAQLN